MSSIRSLRKTTLPGVVAMLTPTSKVPGVDWRSFSLPRPASMSSASIFMPRTRFSPFCFKRLAEELRIRRHEIRGRQSAGELADVELRLVLGVRVDALGALHQILGPARGDQVGLLDEIEERDWLGPFRIAERACRRAPARRRAEHPRPASGASIPSRAPESPS